MNKQLEAGVVEPTQSEWAAPEIFAAKKEGRLRFVVDYRHLNAVIIGDSYPLPRMEECIDSLGTARVFLRLDANYGFWKAPIRQSNGEKTEVRLPHRIV